MKELADSGVKYNPDDVVMITKTPDGKLLWLENGNSSAGLKHIIEKHTSDFAGRGIDVDGISTMLNKALSMKPIEVLSNSRGYYAIYVIDGKSYTLAYGTNGFIVSFYPSY